jgi:hypothetical protein
MIRTLSDGEKISPEFLSECVTYDGETGAFTWKLRPLSHFVNFKAFATWNAKFAGNPAFTSNCRGYFYSRVSGKKMYAHRAAWAVTYGEFPKEIDHKNGNPSDNRIINLRAADRLTNNCNVASAKGSSSKFLGVSWSRKDRRWVAAITKNRVRTVLGYFRNESDAAAAYDAAARTVHGEFARLNFGGAHVAS